jgi:hypothetical protein
MVSSSRIIRQAHAFTPTQQGAPRAKLKVVEVNCSEHEPVYKVVTIPFDTGFGVVDLKTYDIDEMQKCARCSRETNPATFSTSIGL